MLHRYGIILMLAAPLAAQDQASTLAGLTDSSAAVALRRTRSDRSHLAAEFEEQGDHATAAQRDSLVR